MLHKSKVTFRVSSEGLNATNKGQLDLGNKLGRNATRDELYYYLLVSKGYLASEHAPEGMQSVFGDKDASPKDKPQEEVS